MDAEDLQANLVRLDQGDRIQPHPNDKVDVLVAVISGRGELTLDEVHQLARWSSPPAQGDAQSDRARRQAARLPVNPPSRPPGLQMGRPARRRQSEFERLRGLGVRFTQEPTEMGPVITTVFDDTCDNLIQIRHQAG